MRHLAACVAGLAVAAAGAGLGGCVIVVDDSDGDAWRSYDDAPRPRIGVTLGRVSEALGRQINVDPSQSVVIESVSYGSPAERAGLQRLDVVYGIDGHDDASGAALRRAIRSKGAGESLTLRIMRGGEPVEATVLIEDSRRNDN